MLEIWLELITILLIGFGVHLFLLSSTVIGICFITMLRYDYLSDKETVKEIVKNPFLCCGISILAVLIGLAIYFTANLKIDFTYYMSGIPFGYTASLLCFYLTTKTKNIEE